MGKEVSLIKRIVISHKDEIKSIVEEFSPEESDIIDAVLDNILSNMDRFVERKDDIIEGDTSLGFFGGGMLTVIIVAIITEAIKNIAGCLTKEGLKKLKSVAKKYFKKSKIDVDESSKEEIIDRVTSIVASSIETQ